MTPTLRDQWCTSGDLSCSRRDLESVHPRGLRHSRRGIPPELGEFPSESVGVREDSSDLDCRTRGEDKGPPSSRKTRVGRTVPGEVFGECQKGSWGLR